MALGLWAVIKACLSTIATLCSPKCVEGGSLNFALVDFLKCVDVVEDVPFGTQRGLIQDNLEAAFDSLHKVCFLPA